MVARKKPIHDIFFKRVFGEKKYATDIFRLVFTPKEFGLFNWKSLRPEITTYVDEEWKEKRTDLVFSVQLKNSKKTAKILFLIEHKSGADRSLLFQMLGYQAVICAKKRQPIIPILVYQGVNKAPYSGPLSLQETLEGLTPALKRAFGKNILDFKCRLLDIQRLKLRGKKDLTARPILFIMQSIMSLTELEVRELLKMALDVPKKERPPIMGLAMEYIQHQSKTFTWKVLQEIESQVLKREDRFMAEFKFSLDRAEEKGLRRGVKQGMEQGIEQGMKKVALKMLGEGAEIHVICKYTDLTPEQVQALSQKSSKSRT